MTAITMHKFLRIPHKPEYQFHGGKFLITRVEEELNDSPHILIIITDVNYPGASSLVGLTEPAMTSVSHVITYLLDIFELDSADLDSKINVVIHNDEVEVFYLIKSVWIFTGVTNTSISSPPQSFVAEEMLVCMTESTTELETRDYCSENAAASLMEEVLQLKVIEKIVG